MKDSSEATAAISSQPKAFAFVLGAIPFVVTMALGVIVTAVGGLTVYADVADPQSRDFEFVMFCLIGTAIGAVAGYGAARRSIEADRDQKPGQAVSLLRKYRRAIQQTGTDKEAGQYHIGE